MLDVSAPWCHPQEVIITKVYKPTYVLKMSKYIKLKNYSILMLFITICDNKPPQLQVLSCLYIYIYMCVCVCVCVNDVSQVAFVGYVKCHPN